MNRNISNSVTYEWVMGRFNGEQAKYISGLAAQGIGYQILERPDIGTAWVVAAFKRPMGALPAHLSRVESPKLLDKLEKHAVPEREDRRSGNAPQRPSL
jgi:hypothetical protein